MGTNFFPSLSPRFGVDPKSGSEDWPQAASGYEQQVKYWLEAAYEEAKYEHAQNEEIQKVAKYVDYIVGKQWPAGRPSYKAAPVNNRVWKLLWELVGLLTDIRPTFEVRNTADKMYDDHAKVLNKVCRAWWLDTDADMTLAFIIIYAILTTGYTKLQWNEDLQNGEGDLELLPLGPNDVLTLKSKYHIQNSQAVIYHSVQPLGFFKKKFPKRAHLVEPDPAFSRYSPTPDRPGHLPAMLYDNLSPGMKRLVGNQTKGLNSVYPEALYREFWIQDWSINTSNVTVKMGRQKTNWCYDVKPGERLYPRGRLLSMGGRAVMDDVPNPYWHGKYPFGMLRMNAVPWQLMGLSDMNSMVQLQDIINNILAGVIDMIKKATNPGFFAPKNAFTEGQWEMMDWGMPGMKAAYSPVAAQKPDFTQAPNLPSYVMQMMMLAQREMDTSSGISAVNQAMQKKQVPSGESLDRIKEAQLTPIRLKGRNIEVFIRDLGSQQISNFFQFYDAKRRMYMLGREKGLVFEDFDWDPGTMVPDGARAEDHVRRFKFMIEPDSLLNARRVEKAMIMLRLRLMGDMDRKHLYEILDLGYNVEDVEKELKREAQAGVPMHPPKGKGQPGGDMTKR